MTMKMAALLAALECRPLTACELRAELERRNGGAVSASGAYHRVKTVVRSGLVRSCGGSRYEITATGRASLEGWRKAVA
jgi:DNA-binding PadR family transcriptional regulator